MVSGDERNAHDHRGPFHKKSSGKRWGMEAFPYHHQQRSVFVCLLLVVCLFFMTLVVACMQPRGDTASLDLNFPRARVCVLVCIAFAIDNPRCACECVSVCVTLVTYNN